MKIMLVTPYFYPKIGGLENYALNVAKGLKAQGHDVFVVTSNHETKEYLDEKVEDLRVIRLPIGLKVSNTPLGFKWYFQLKKIIKTEKPDVINAHSPVPGMADMAFAARSKVPFVTTYHAGSLKKGGSPIDVVLSFYEKTFLKHMLRRSNEVASVYPAFVEKLIGSKKEVHFIPPGVSPEFKPRRGKYPASQTILYVGRIEKSSSWKGIDTLIDSMREVLLRFPEARLQLVGEGDAVDDYKQLAQKYGIQDRIIFSGALRGQKLITAFQEASMLVLPSKTDAEAFGIVLIEAMACGIPVIGSRVGGIPNVIQDGKNGLLVPPSNPNTLAKAIKKLFGDQKLAHTLATDGSKRASEEFSAVKLVQNTFALLSKAARPEITHVTAYYPPHLGGMEKVVQALASTQHHANIPASVITSNCVKKVFGDENEPFSVSRLKSLEIAHTPIMPWLFFKLLKTRQNTIAHLHVAQAYTPEMVWLASKFKHFNYIAHIHLDVTPSGPAGILLRPYKRLILKRVLRSAKYVIVFTEGQKADVNKKYGVQSANIKVIPNGVESKFYYDEVRTIHKKPRLLFVGRLDYQKNLQQMLRALDGISDQFETTLVGDGELLPELKNLTKELNLKNINFAGRKDGAELLGYYKEADIFVLSSEREGMPLVLLEAMAMGLPVVATNVTGNRDVIKDGQNGLLVPYNDTKAFREALTKIKSDSKLYSTMSRTARNMAARYSWNRISELFDLIYHEVLS